MSTPRLLVIQHEDDCTLAWFGEWLGAAGVGFDAVLGHRGDVVPDDLGGYDALVVLGGAMGAYDDASCPWLTSTKALIAKVVAARQCFLGICLGHQLAAVALGGQVIANPLGQANGLSPVALTPAGQVDQLAQVIATGARSVQWNDDIVSRLPEGAVELATAPDGTVQMASFGERAWGVQFHPEASPEVFDSWIRAAEVSEPLVVDRLHDVLDQITSAEADLRRDWEPLARRFAQVVASQPAIS